MPVSDIFLARLKKAARDIKTATVSNEYDHLPFFKVTDATERLAAFLSYDLNLPFGEAVIYAERLLEVYAGRLR